MTNSMVHCKNSDLFDKLSPFFSPSMNLARIKFISLLILALCKVQTVSFYRLSTAFESGPEALGYSALCNLPQNCLWNTKPRLLGRCRYVLPFHVLSSIFVSFFSKVFYLFKSCIGLFFGVFILR